MAQGTAQADLMQNQVAARLSELNPGDAQQAQQQINQVLLIAQKHFPAAKGHDDRISADPGYRASAKHADVAALRTHEARMPPHSFRDHVQVEAGPISSSLQGASGSK